MINKCVRVTLEGKFVRHAEVEHAPMPEKGFLTKRHNLSLGTENDLPKYFSCSGIIVTLQLRSFFSRFVC